METMVGVPVVSEEQMELVPCAATMSRAHAKIDLAHCVLRQQQWEDRASQHLDYAIHLSALAFFQKNSYGESARTQKCQKPKLDPNLFEASILHL